MPIENNKISLYIKRTPPRNMKKHSGTRKRRSPPRRTRKRRAQRGGYYGDQTLYLVTSESPSRPGYPIMRVIPMEGDGMGGFMGIERNLSDIAFGVEDSLLALKMNRGNKKVPKRAIVKKLVIRKPLYLPKP